MRVLKKEEDIMLELNPKFQNKLFLEIIKSHGRKTVSLRIKKSKSILYHYKNNRVRAVPKIVVFNAVKLSKYSKKDLLRNTVRTFSAKEKIKEIMRLGAKINHQKIKERLSIKFGAYNLLERGGALLTLDVLDWLNKNQWIESLKKQKGLIKNVQVTNISKKYIKITYLAYNKKTKRCEPYTIFLPRFLEIDKDLCYFLGLLHGDGLYGARVGIVNMNKNLIRWTANFLKKYFKNNKRKAQIFLYQKSHGIKVRGLSTWLKLFSEEVEIYHNPKARGSYVFNIFITNRILRRILDDFIVNLEELFSELSYQQKGAFLAGFFDAEGNVNKLDRNLRFSQKNENNVRVIQLILNKEGYHTRYDGSNIIIGFKKEYKDDLTLFKKQILPFLKHSEKTKQADELIRGYLVREEYRPMLRIISKNPDISQKQIAIKIKRVKCHRKLIALLEAGFIKRKRERMDESFKYHIIDKGLKYLEEN